MYLRISFCQNIVLPKRVLPKYHFAKVSCFQKSCFVKMSQCYVTAATTSRPPAATLVAARWQGAAAGAAVRTGLVVWVTGFAALSNALFVGYMKRKRVKMVGR